MSNEAPRGISPLSLAFVGDGVFELLVRERLLQNGPLPAGKLHRLAVKQVSAKAQATAYNAFAAALNEQELAILKRGRNANSATVPKSCTPEEYRKATAIEAVFGFLYLSGQTERINELYQIIDDKLRGE